MGFLFKKMMFLEKILCKNHIFFFNKIMEKTRIFHFLKKKKCNFQELFYFIKLKMSFFERK